MAWPVLCSRSLPRRESVIGALSSRLMPRSHCLRSHSGCMGLATPSVFEVICEFYSKTKENIRVTKKKKLTRTLTYIWSAYTFSAKHLRERITAIYGRGTRREWRG